MRGLSAVIALCPTAIGQAADSRSPFPASKPNTGPAFNFSQWRKFQADIDFNQHNINHPSPHGGWFGADDDNCAKNYHITWGPLGIRTLMHDHSWACEPAFKRAWPKVLLSKHGDLLFDCFEVIHVIPGSPADGHLRKGDFLIAMDGERFRTAKALHLNTPEWQHQGSRSLEMDAGEKLDLAEGRGKVSFDVIRPDETTNLTGIDTTISQEVFASKEIPQQTGTNLELEIPVQAGQELTILLEITRSHNGACGATLIRPRLEGDKGTLDLTNLRTLGEKSGWASIVRGTGTYKDQTIKESIWFHAPGNLTWMIPAGYKTFRATLIAPAGATGYRARGIARSTLTTLPEILRKYHQTVDFNIPRIGSYGRGFPGNHDAKSTLVANMTAAWLADHQQADGSWPRNVGYTHRGYDTAYAGLGLLAHGDPAYDSHIRKAAEFIAFQCPQDHWSVPTSMMIMFLSEYWLRSHDDRILPPLAGLVNRLSKEMIYGDFTSGHGAVPGYRGTGVSIGGSHAALALSLAELTPAKPEPGLVDRMLARAQELGPDGYIPYGRSTSTRSFDPNLTSGPTYSGRHGPYLIASHIHGGPRLFTENCAAIYARGPVGGIDQGHATQTLSTSWGLLACANVSPNVLARQIEALRWKLTMLRCHDGGFGWNAYRLEYQGGEGLLPPYLRSGALLMILNAPKANLAMTGAPKWKSNNFPNLPPVCHNDAVTLAYYQRNWGVAASVLGSRTPPSLQQGLATLLTMGHTSSTHQELFDFLKTHASSTAQDILKLPLDDHRLTQYLAEMIMGVDLRLSAEPQMKNDQPDPGKWSVNLQVQHPLAGYFEGANPETRAAWQKNPPLPMSGTVTITDFESNPVLTKPINFSQDCGTQGWQTQTFKEDFSTPATIARLPLVAHFQYRIGDMSFDYSRSFTGGADEPGSGEKERKLIGDRVVMVTGILAHELGGWNASFILPSGQFISAASQGNAVQVTHGNQSWTAPDAGSLPAGSTCQFGFSSGWQPYEARVGSVIWRENPTIPSPSIKIGGTPSDATALSDRNPTTSIKTDQDLIELTWQTPTTISALDLRLKNPGQDTRLLIEAAQANGSWLPLYSGVVTNHLRSFPPVTTQQLKITLGTPGTTHPSREITEVIAFGPASTNPPLKPEKP